MARWKIVNRSKAEELGIKEVNPDNDGFIIVDTSQTPKGLSIENIIKFAEKNGIIIQNSV